jgi:hypothetical protein
MGHQHTPVVPADLDIQIAVGDGYDFVVDLRGPADAAITNTISKATYGAATTVSGAASAIALDSATNPTQVVIDNTAKSVTVKVSSTNTAGKDAAKVDHALRVRLDADATKVYTVMHGTLEIVTSPAATPS